MIQEQVDQMNLGWSREQLARASGVTVAAVYLLERMGSAGSKYDARIRKSLAEGKAKHATPHADPDTEGFVQSASNNVLNFPYPKHSTSSDSKDVEGRGEADDGNSASPADMA